LQPLSGVPVRGVGSAHPRRVSEVRRRVRHREDHEALRHGPALRARGVRLAKAGRHGRRRRLRGAAGAAHSGAGARQAPGDDGGRGAPDAATLERAMTDARVTIIGGGLAGCEAAWQLARRGIGVDLYEMRPVRGTAAHTGDRLSELVCSNSFRNATLETAVGLLKEEMRRLGSVIMRVADATRVPAGACLAVDRIDFAAGVTRAVETLPRVRVVREEMTEIPAGLTILASGPLTSPALSQALQSALGTRHLYFY